jgi:predicted dehydrogenase
MMNRRDFLSTAAVASSTLAGGWHSFGQDAPKKLRIGLIGCGWYGMVNLRHLIDLEAGEITALCDVDKKHLQDAFKEVKEKTKKEPATFEDYRDMLKPKNLDVVLVSTPDHWHALCTIAAMEAGADVMVEKPICHTYLEGQAMLRTARKLKRIVQVDTQRRSTPHIAKAREFIKGGGIGTIGHMKGFCYYNMRANQIVPDSDPPEGFNFDLWTGPAPLRKYNRLIHPRSWRAFEEYGNGILGDMAIHMMDVGRWVTGVRSPKTIHSVGGIFVQKKSTANITDTQTVTWDFGDLTACWEHRSYGRSEQNKYDWGITFYGEKGTVTVTLDTFDFEPWGGNKNKPISEKVKMIEDPAKQEDPKVREAGRAHMKNFIDCVHSRKTPIAELEEGHLSSALCCLGTISQKLGRSIRWDAEKEMIVGDEEANKLLKREYRAGYTYPSA